MEYLTLNNGIRMPLVGFGTFMLGGDTCKKAVAAAIETGYRMIDTAEAYGNEKEVGEGIQQSGIDRRQKRQNIYMSAMQKCYRRPSSVAAREKQRKNKRNKMGYGNERYFHISPSCRKF